MQNQPPPTTLTLLSKLGDFPPTSKVRFLGCVTNYDTKTAILTLEHDHPLGNRLQAQVDVRVLLSTMKSTQSQIGEWLNVMGYVLSHQNHTKTEQERRRVYIHATMLWSAESFNLQAYEMSLNGDKS